MNHATKVQMLRTAAMFAATPTRALDGLARRAEACSVGRGEYVFREGESGEDLYVVAKGLLKVSVRSDGGELLLTTLHEGDAFGEIALIDDEPRSASVEAVVDSELLSLDRTSVLEELRHQPVRCRASSRRSASPFAA